MTAFKQFLQKIFSGIESQEQLDEDYLAQSVYTADLERRIHDLEYRRTAHDTFPLHPEVTTHEGRRVAW